MGKEAGSREQVPRIRIAGKTKAHRSGARNMPMHGSGHTEAREAYVAPAVGHSGLADVRRGRIGPTGLTSAAGGGPDGGRKGAEWTSEIPAQQCLPLSLQVLMKELFLRLTGCRNRSPRRQSRCLAGILCLRLVRQSRQR